MEPAKKATTPSKKRYSKPELVEYGDLAKLTQSGGSVFDDGTGTKRKRMPGDPP